MSSDARSGGDRRSHDRFEILGRVWGTLESVAGMTVYNISHGGALVASPVPLEAGSLHQIAVRRGDAQGTVQARVRHSRPNDAGEPGYLIGMEFIALTSAVRALIDGLGGDVND